MSTKNLIAFNKALKLNDNEINLFLEEHSLKELEESKFFRGRRRKPYVFDTVETVELVACCGYYEGGTLDYITLKDYFNNDIDYNLGIKDIISEMDAPSKLSKKALIKEIFYLLNEFYFQNKMDFDFEKYNFKHIKKPTKKDELEAFIQNVLKCVLDYDIKEAVRELDKVASMYGFGVSSSSEGVDEAVNQ